ncbi:hypothetical protein ABL78_2708 [Leptomonas seymouri]|uniref:Uncharacterized protein n=1 Tax=Leptomonas seymouri TaxID=5684 RepID=A0A0N1PCB8_LEPSE|nr:hypothetical protein ABL78_2708 [Leptomonas seymouri]|eukprot:KPI88204.1 hypothetical protein ABL78_2708 [Leptomonas seymouri]
MDFESFLQSEALRPLSIIYSRALLDCPETASMIGRLPPPKIALLYHAALMPSPLMETDVTQPQVAERLSARIVSAYCLAGKDHEKPYPETALQRPGASDESDTGAAGARQRFPTCFPPLPPPPLCYRYAHSGDAFQHLEHAMSQREASLQQWVVEAMMKMHANASNHTEAPPFNT